MSNKIQYRAERGGDYIEFNSEYLHIKLPNGNQFRLHFDPKEEVLTIQKEWGGANETKITIHPGVSNVIHIN